MSGAVSKPGQCEVYRIPLRGPLPTLRIPLRVKDKDAELNLQAILDLAYRKGRYYSTLDYDELPDPPLRGDDSRWAQTLVRKAKKR